MNGRGWRDEIFYWLCCRAGVRDCRLPAWLILIGFILFPNRIRWWCASSVYDFSTNTIKVGKERISLFLLEQMFGPPYPKPWLRVVGSSENGLMIERWYGPPDTPNGLIEEIGKEKPHAQEEA